MGGGVREEWEGKRGEGRGRRREENEGLKGREGGEEEESGRGESEGGLNRTKIR